jgi:hypothetical protein
MPGSLGILTGAGISVDAPASLPLGDEFHERLLWCCHAAARRFAPEAVTAGGIQLLISGGRRNILGCIEDCLDTGTVADVLGCMRVRIPTEAHLLCALHAAHGARHATINFDNGVELAYALLTGAAELPDDAPAEYRDALGAWRATMPDSGPLRVVSTPHELAERCYGDQPTLIKLRGSVDIGTDGTVVPLRPALEDLESTRLDEDRFAALCAVAASEHLLITGHSGRDLDCFESLRGLLRPARFSWVVPEISAAVASRLRAIDPAQPIIGEAGPALRAYLPGLPEWPRITWHPAAFERRFELWWSRVPPVAAAQAYAWMLSEAGRHAEPIAILRALLHAGGGARVRLRLADLLARRGQPADLAEAARIFNQAAGGTATRAEIRAYAWTRRTECQADATPLTIRRALVGAVYGSSALLITPPRKVRMVARVLAALGYLARQAIDGQLPTAGRSRTRIAMLTWLARAALGLLHAARRRADRAGTGTRQSDLELEVVATQARLCLLSGGPPPADAMSRLVGVQRAYAHRGNSVGELRVLSTLALIHLAAGRPAEYTDLLHEVTARADGQEYAHTAGAMLARLRLWAQFAISFGRCSLQEGEGNHPCHAETAETTGHLETNR